MEHKIEELPAYDVAVAIVVKNKRVLLEYDDDWRAFSFPMSKRREGETWEYAAARAAAEAIGILSRPEELFSLPDTEVSWRDMKIKRYNLKFFLCDPVEGDVTPIKTVVWISIDLVADKRKPVEPIPPSTRQFAQELISQCISILER